MHVRIVNVGCSDSHKVNCEMPPIQEESLDGYRCADWMEFMGDLEKKFRDTVLKEMRKLL